MLAIFGAAVIGAIAGAWIGMRYVVRLMGSQLGRRFEGVVMSDTHAARLMGSYHAYGRMLHIVAETSVPGMRAHIEREMDRIELVLRERAQHLVHNVEVSR